MLACRPATAAVLPWLGLEEITAQAEVIVLGKVERLEGGWSDDGRIIVTRVTLAVEHPVKGGPRERVVLEVPGGRVGDLAMVASGAPLFAPGERVIVFLEPSGTPAPDGTRPNLAVVGWNLGAMRVRRDAASGRDLVDDQTGGAIYLDRQGRPVDPGRQGRGPRELGQFLRDIAGIVARVEKGSGAARSGHDAGGGHPVRGGGGR
ncbi:MAG TPA: hypothetical protein VFT43_09095 [Candidatus Polarisedimenticolia bacterium]|nr:hypothetical protein [Candidatus Polarisedimenticolia bacterium]